METEQIEKIMYALTVSRKPNSRALWLDGGRINKIFKFHRFSLLKYWEKKIQREPDVLKQALKIYEEYLESVNVKQVEDRIIEAQGYVSSRDKICGGCEWREDGGINGGGVCGQCGCNIWTKIRMLSATCPIQKW